MSGFRVERYSFPFDCLSACFLIRVWEAFLIRNNLYSQSSVMYCPEQLQIRFLCLDISSSTKMILRFACEAPITQAWFMFAGTTYGTPASPISPGPDQSLLAIISQQDLHWWNQWTSRCDPDSRHIF